MMCCVTKATLIDFIDNKCHIKQLKSRKNYKTCLTNHTRSISHHITPLVINALGGGHTCMHTNAQTKVISRNQERTSLQPACLWFKNHFSTYKINVCMYIHRYYTMKISSLLLFVLVGYWCTHFVSSQGKNHCTCVYYVCTC